MLRFICPECQCHRLTLADRACPECGYPFTVGGVARHYWQKLRSAVAAATSVRCPRCQQVVPASAQACLHCGEPVTVSAALRHTAAPVQGVYQRVCDPRNSTFRKRFQLVYLFASILLLYALVSDYDIPSFRDWAPTALLSVLYVAAVIMMIVWVAPPKRQGKPVRRISPMVRIALVLNVLSLVMVLQIMINHAWDTAVNLAELLLTVLASAILVFHYLWPVKNSFEDALDKQRSPKDAFFDPGKPQGRKGEVE